VGTPGVQVLSSADRDAVDEAARQLLEHTGVDVHSAAAREALERQGARTTAGRSRVLFAPGLIDRALATAPKTILLASRDRKHDVRIPNGRTHVTTDGCGVNVLDLDTGARRSSTTRDLAELTRVADALDAVALQWPMVVAGDAPQETHGIVEAATVFEHTAKHVQHEALSVGDAETLVAMAAAIAGGPEALRERPLLSVVQCPVSPLTLAEGATEGLMVFARAGVPIVPVSMVLLGGSSPVDAASALVVGNAENLASLCVAQSVAPGAPVLWSSASGPIDMRTGAFAAGAPESALLNVAGVEMARHYGLPCLVAGFVTDADSYGFQAGAEKMATGLLSMLAGADLVAGVGALETDNTLSVEQLVLDADLVEYARRTAASFRVDSDSLHLDMLSRLGPAGNYLKERHTLAHFREALWAPSVLLRDGHEEGRTSDVRVKERARVRGKQLAESHRPPALEADVLTRVRELAGLPTR
jgi:trimethylamine---corrinoid protein Co-methyltransferase